jgi:hypothetical protein
MADLLYRIAPSGVTEWTPDPAAQYSRHSWHVTHVHSFERRIEGRILRREHPGHRQPSVISGNMLRPAGQTLVKGILV